MYQFKLISVISLFLWFFVSCVPLEKNLVLAESAIKQARKVNAPTYAVKDFDHAVEDLDEAKKLKEIKKKKPANTKAVSSIGNAQKAYHVAVVEFEKKQVEVTTEAKDEADEASAATLAKKTYDEAMKTFNEAKSKMKEVNEKRKQLEKLETKGAVNGKKK